MTQPYLRFNPDFCVIVAAIAGLAGVLYLLFSPKKKLPLPPYSKSSLLENLCATAVQKSLYQLLRYRGFANDISPDSFGGSIVGSTFQIRVPFLDPWIITTDYILARAFLSGDTKRNIKENERSHIAQRMNFLDRNEGNLLTLPTSDQERHRTRKDIAPAFSSANLLQSWPHIRAVLSEQFARFREMSARGEVMNAKSTIVLFFMRTLARGAFGVNFTDDGTEDDNSINGLAYLNAMDAAARESSRQVMFPLRRFFFWDEGVKRNVAAQMELHRAAVKILKLRNAQQKQPSSPTHTKPVTILDHIVQHSYLKQITRLSDVTLFGFAGIDTTAYTFCFLLMEVARHPDVQHQLQKELAHFMPPLPSAYTRSDNNLPNEKDMLTAIAGCEYLNHCVREILRLWPVAASGPGRDLVQDIEYNGMLLPKGSLVIANLFSMFRERWIDQPDAFLPDRWCESNPQLPQLKDMLIPFSIGRRNCIGQNMAMFQLKIVAAHFFHYFEFELVDEPTFEFFLTLKPDQLKLRLYERVQAK